MTENVLTINDRLLSFEPGDMLLDVARRNDIDIPTLCHLKGQRPTGACRICVVEVEGAGYLLPACDTRAAAGMVVQTHSEAVVEARRTILKLLLAPGRPFRGFIRNNGEMSSCPQGRGQGRVF